MIQAFDEEVLDMEVLGKEISGCWRVPANPL